MVDFGILIYPGIRSRMYLDELKKNGLKPNVKILFSGDFEEEVDYKVNGELNSDAVKKVLKNCKEKYFIFTGGGILDKEMCKLKRFIHVHPGIIPDYRGSTCFYYSYLEEDYCGATAFIMNEKIDKGDIIASQKFENPKTIDMDNQYDPWMRSQLLIDVIKNEKFLETTPQVKGGRNYYVIHPVLKHLALLKVENLLRKN